MTGIGKFYSSNQIQNLWLYSNIDFLAQRGLVVSMWVCFCQHFFQPAKSDPFISMIKSCALGNVLFTEVDVWVSSLYLLSHEFSSLLSHVTLRRRPCVTMMLSFTCSHQDWIFHPSSSSFCQNSYCQSCHITPSLRAKSTNHGWNRYIDRKFDDKFDFIGV